MWETTCRICKKTMSGTPKRCKRCGANLEVFGDRCHYNTELSLPKGWSNKLLELIHLENEQKLRASLAADISHEEKSAEVLKNLSAVIRDGRYVTSIENDDIKTFIDEDGRYYIAVYFDLPVYYLCSKKSDYKVVEGMELVNALASSPIIDGLLLNPTFGSKYDGKPDHSCFVDRSKILCELGVDGIDHIEKYRCDGFNRDYFIFNTIKEISNKLDNHIKEGIKEAPRAEYYSDALMSMVNKEYVSEINDECIDKEALASSIVKGLIESLCK